MGADQQPTERLYRGAQLKEARAWARRNVPSKHEMAFIRASTARGIRNGVSIVVVLLLLLATTGVTGWFLFHLPLDPTHVINSDDDGQGSLRWSIANVKEGGTITFDQRLSGKTILLTSGDLNITKSLHINGPDRGTLAISSGQSGYVFFVHKRVVVTITNLTFANSSRNSGFITNEGNLTLTHCIISGNEGGVGPLYNNHGNLILNTSTVSGNNAANGGGINNSGGTVTVTASTISGNRALNGGGINSNDGTFTLINSTVSKNDGTGINNIASKLTLIGSTISNNRGYGGGIVNRNGQLLLNNSTISDNSGGGIFNEGGQSSLINSTISNNTGYSGIFVEGGWVNITFCTIYGNSALYSGGGISLGNPNYLSASKENSLTIKNSIVVNNHANTGPDISGSVISYGYNLIQNLSGASFIAPLDIHATDISGFTLADLKIDPTLHNNGGSTQTYALLVGSPAIDQIPLQYCQVKEIFNEQSQMYTDQRGVKRSDENEPACDIGAYEYVDSPA